ncbi:MAG: type II toxin-antitoxin system HicA family toxin [Candidatus Eremiobacteraeota bacterium]|nr:type II toxin-antitoxin system HicA family toxin [Candidatus Eremiobacteraeota bacterium]
MNKVLEELGFVNTRKSPESHRHYCHPDGSKTKVPFHKGTNIGRGLLRKILRDIKITPEELGKLL